MGEEHFWLDELDPKFQLKAIQEMNNYVNELIEDLKLKKGKKKELEYFERICGNIERLKTKMMFDSTGNLIPNLCAFRFMVYDYGDFN